MEEISIKFYGHSIDIHGHSVVISFKDEREYLHMDNRRAS